MSFIKVLILAAAVLITSSTAIAETPPKSQLDAQLVHGTRNVYNAGVVIIDDHLYPASVHMLRITAGQTELVSLPFTGTRTYTFEKTMRVYWYMYRTASADQVWVLSNSDGTYRLVWGFPDRKTKTWTTDTRVLQPLNERWKCSGFDGYAYAVDTTNPNVRKHLANAGCMPVLGEVNTLKQ